MRGSPGARQTRGGLGAVDGTGGTESPLTTKGDIWGYNTTDARIPISTDGKVLTTDSTDPLGVSWQVPSSAGFTRWSLLTAPLANLSIAMAAFTTTFTWNAATGAATNMFTMTDTAANTGTGAVLRVQTAATSSAAPLDVAAVALRALYVAKTGKVFIGIAAGSVSGTAGSLQVNGRAATTNPRVLDVIGASGLTAIAGTVGSFATQVLFNPSEVEFTTGARVSGALHEFRSNPIDFVGASVVNCMSTVLITEAPVAGTNATVNFTYGLLVDNTSIGVNGGNLVVGTASGGSNGELRIAGDMAAAGTGDGTYSHYVGFKAGPTATSTTYTLPLADGTANQRLTTNGSAVLSWTSIAWSTLTAPAANLSLAMAAFTTTLTWGSATGAAVSCLTLTDTASNTGTGILLDVKTASDSVLNPFAVTIVQGTNATRIMCLYTHIASGTIAAGFGNEIRHDLKSGGTTAFSERITYTTTTAAAEVAKVAYAIVNAGSLPAVGSEQFTFAPVGLTTTGYVKVRVSSAGDATVRVGNSDTCGLTSSGANDFGVLINNAANLSAANGQWDLLGINSFRFKQAIAISAPVICGRNKPATGITWPSTTTDQLDFVSNGVLVIEINTATADPLLGFYGITATTQGAVGATIANNITAGGTTNVLDDWSNFTVYATDAAAIRNACYQLGLKLNSIEAKLKLLGAVKT